MLVPFQGNIQFECDGESVQVVGLEAVNHIAELTSTEPDTVSKSLLYRTVATGGGEIIEKGHTQQEASSGRDAFAKVLFFHQIMLCATEVVYTKPVS